MDFGTSSGGHFSTQTDLDRLECLYSHDRGRDSRIESITQQGATTQTDGTTGDMHLAESTNRVLVHLGGPNGIHHPLGCLRIGRVDLGGIAGRSKLFDLRGLHHDIGPDLVDASHETEDLNSKCLQQTTGRGPRRRPRGGLPGTRSLERVTTIVGQPLDASRQIRVARSGPVNRRCSFGIIETAVLVGNLHHERRTGGSATADARQERGAIGLDPLPGAPSVPSLTTSEFLVDEVDVEIEARWEAREDGQSAWAM